MKTSAKDNSNINEAFSELIEIKLSKFTPKPLPTNCEVPQNVYTLVHDISMQDDGACSSVKSELIACNAKFNASSGFYTPQSQKISFIQEVLSILQASKDEPHSQRAYFFLLASSLSFSKKQLFRESASTKTADAFRRLALFQLSNSQLGFDDVLSSVTYHGKKLNQL